MVKRDLFSYIQPPKQETSKEKGKKVEEIEKQVSEKRVIAKTDNVLFTEGNAQYLDINALINNVIVGNALNVLKKFRDCSVDFCITSPPYWSVRNYKSSPVIWDADPKCDHKWIHYIKPKNCWGEQSESKHSYKGETNASFVDDVKLDFCEKCSAWKGELGQEPVIDLYINHLCSIFDEVKRVLTPYGSLWVVIGDTYWGGGRGYDSLRGGEKGEATYESMISAKPEWDDSLPNRSLCLIPSRFGVEMIKRRWVLRNKVIWHKSNVIPAPHTDKFTVDYEEIFFFTKENDDKTLFWVNENTRQLVAKCPKGTRGIEGTDWEWRVCYKCGGTGIIKDKELTRELSFYFNDEESDYIDIEQSTGDVCKKCNGTGEYKYNFWRGKKYFFIQQFEPLKTVKSGIVTRMSPVGGKKFIDEKVNRMYSGNAPMSNPLGRNMRCVWDIPTKGCKESHFAVFPLALLTLPVKAGLPRYVCKQCGMPRFQVIITEPIKIKYEESEDIKVPSPLYPKDGRCVGSNYHNAGYTDCGCNTGYRRGIMLDPFIGSGTSGLKALKMGRDFIGIDIRNKYKKITEKRISPMKNVKSLDDIYNSLIEE